MSKSTFGNGGFVLPTTLLLLAVLSMAAAYFAQWTQRGVEQATTHLAGSRGELEMESTRATLVYLLATRLYTRGGLMAELDQQLVKALAGLAGQRSIAATGDEIALDGRAYRGLGQSRFSLQDSGGLLGLNALNTRRFGRLLGLLDIPLEERSGLIAKLQDYTDLDDLHRLNGAEADAYRKAGRPGPPNRPLQTAWEGRMVMGWDGQPSLWKDHRLALLTTAIGGANINLNTSPVEVLGTLDGIDLDAARRIVAARPLSGLSDASRAIGRRLPLDPMTVVTLASNTMRLRLWHPNTNSQHVFVLQLTPMAEQGKPWENLFELELPFEHLQHQVLPTAAPGALLTTTDLVSD